MAGTIAHCDLCLHPGPGRSQHKPIHLSCRTVLRQSYSLHRGWNCSSLPQLRNTKPIGKQCRADSSSTDGRPGPHRSQHTIEAERAMESLHGNTKIGSEYGEVRRVHCFCILVLLQRQCSIRLLCLGVCGVPNRCTAPPSRCRCTE